MIGMCGQNWIKQIKLVAKGFGAEGLLIDNPELLKKEIEEIIKFK